MFSADVRLRVRLSQDDLSAQETHAGENIVDAKAAGIKSTADQVTELCKQSAMSEEYVQQLTAELAEVKEQLLTVTSKSLELSEKLSTVEVDAHKRLEEHSAAKLACA